MTTDAPEPAGATPLQPEDHDALIPTWIATRSDLNAAEQENVATGSRWALGHSWTVEELDHAWLKGLHRRMFGDVWRWAGSFRTTDTNLGAHWVDVPQAVEAMLRDLHAQAAELSSLPWTRDELAVRFHHRCVWIHPFANGNGRHARLAADVVVVALGGRPFEWGAGDELLGPGLARASYLEALRSADSGDFTELLAFARR